PFFRRHPGTEPSHAPRARKSYVARRACDVPLPRCWLGKGTLLESSVPEQCPRAPSPSGGILHGAQGVMQVAAQGGQEPREQSLVELELDAGVARRERASQRGRVAVG